MMKWLDHQHLMLIVCSTQDRLNSWFPKSGSHLIGGSRAGRQNCFICQDLDHYNRCLSIQVPRVDLSIKQRYCLINFPKKDISCEPSAIQLLCRTPAQKHVIWCAPASYYRKGVHDLCVTQLKSSTITTCVWDLNSWLMEDSKLQRWTNNFWYPIQKDVVIRQMW